MKTFPLILFLCGGLVAGAAAAQTPGDPTPSAAPDDRTIFINRAMRQVVLPLNGPADPDRIPVGYRVEMPGPAEARIAEPGEHFWLFTRELADRHGLYEEWIAAGKPEPVGEFVHTSLEESAALGSAASVPADTAAATSPEAAADAVAEPEPVESAAAEEPGGSSWWIWVLLVLVILSAAGWVLFQQQRREREAA